MNIITVAELNSYIKILLESDAKLRNILVRGEISNLTCHSSGHIYFTLKDEKALVKAVMFRSSASTLKFKPSNGMRIVVEGRVSLFERDGQYQLYATSMMPDGIGELALAFEQLKQKLQKEGLFDQSAKKPLPKYPARIGIITSPTGAAVQDMINILRRRYPLATVIFAPVLVQGVQAPGEIINALNTLNRLNACDVIIAGRGGGSLEELWAFNDEALARAVYSSAIPVVSAVGHETDFTICDFVSDLRAPTPSAAAELVTPDIADISFFLKSAVLRIERGLVNKLRILSQRLESLSARECLVSPLFHLKDKGQSVDGLETRLMDAIMNIIRLNKEKLGIMSAKLEILSPLSLLARGYSIVSTDKGVVTSADQLSLRDELNIRLSKGAVSCTVTKIFKQEIV